MDPAYIPDVLSHLEKQDELLMNSYRSMSHELHKLQVEEEMLMRAFYDLMSAQGLTTKKQDGTSVPDERQDGTSVPDESDPAQSKALINVDTEEKR